nr:translation initiation factor 2 [Streptomyces sp. RFCAC02]
MLPVFADDPRVHRLFTLVPGSDFQADAFSAIDLAGARTVPWDEACRRSFDLVIAASPKGRLDLLRGARVLLPHGAGHSKVVPGEGSGGPFPSAFDPVNLLADGPDPVFALHALAHPDDVGRLAAASPRDAERATVVGDPTLERLLASRDRRERFRAALGTGGRTLIAVTSTWGGESLFARRPRLPAELTARLPYDRFQVAFVLHPNEFSRLGAHDLAETYDRARRAGLVMTRPYEEWASVLVAADAVVTDHGSTALYAAALGRPVVAAYDGGRELTPGTPMARLLAAAPRLGGPDDALGPDAVTAAVAAHRPEAVRAAARAAFAEQGRALERLRAEVYALLGLPPQREQPTARLLPDPARPVEPAVFTVRARVEGATVRLERLPAPPAGEPDRDDAFPHRHLAAEYGAAGTREIQTAGVVHRRAAAGPGEAGAVAWTADGWTSAVLRELPGRRTAAVLFPGEGLCLVRTGGPDGPLLAVRAEPAYADGRVHRADPAAVVSAVHAWRTTDARGAADRADLVCAIGDRSYTVHVSPAARDAAARPV